MIRGGSEGLHEGVVLRVVSAALRHFPFQTPTSTAPLLRLVLEVVRRFSTSKKVSTQNLHLATVRLLRLRLATTIMLGDSGVRVAVSAADAVNLRHGPLLLSAAHRSGLTETTLLGLHGTRELLLLGVSNEILSHYMTLELVVDVHRCLVGGRRATTLLLLGKATVQVLDKRTTRFGEAVFFIVTLPVAASLTATVACLAVLGGATRTTALSLAVTALGSLASEHLAHLVITLL